MEEILTDGALIVCQTAHGIEIHGTICELNRFRAVFEVYTPGLVIQTSEVLGDFRVVVNQNTVYSGRAVVANVVTTGMMVVCEATLEDGWIDNDLFQIQGKDLRAGFDRFIRQWQKEYRIRPEFKIVVADIQSFLHDLRIWVEQVELGIRSQPSGDRSQFERQALIELREVAGPSVKALFERFENAASEVEPQLEPAHRAYAKRQLHPIVLCAPFMYRSFQKPLGYAGDYEMINMMGREPFEGGTIFAKLLNSLFLATPPVEAHRNRITYLVQQLTDEVTRVRSAGRAAKIFNVGCGPAREVQVFIAKSILANDADFALLDFNDETLAHATSVLGDLIAKHGRRTIVRPLKKSVTQLLKEAAMPNSKLSSAAYDFVYCAGLFDYMPDAICQRLMNLFYQMTAPGGLLLVTNVDPSNPSRHWMRYAVDWHLLYRDAKKLESFRPKDAADSRVEAELTGVNVILRIRKPANA